MERPFFRGSSGRPRWEVGGTGRDMRGQEKARPKNTTVGMLRNSCCFVMGRWGYAKREEFVK
eukprot:1209031-Pyramimonas_sp.AAC.1